MNSLECSPDYPLRLKSINACFRWDIIIGTVLIRQERITKFCWLFSAYTRLSQPQLAKGDTLWYDWENIQTAFAWGWFFLYSHHLCQNVASFGVGGEQISTISRRLPWPSIQIVNKTIIWCQIKGNGELRSSQDPFITPNTSSFSG